MNSCPNGVCNSEHSPEEYAIGYFVVDGEVIAVKGEAAAMRASRETIVEARADGLPEYVANPDYLGATIYWDKQLAKAVAAMNGDVVGAFQAEARRTVLKDLTDEEFAIYTYGAPHPLQTAQLAAAMERIQAAALVEAVKP
jgi:hypothetical protein